MPPPPATPPDDALLLAAVASGDLRALDRSSSEALAPFLPLLARLEASRAVASPLLLRSERAASLLDLARELRLARPADVAVTSDSDAAPTDEPSYRRFERGDPRVRAGLVLAELQAQPQAPSELFAHAVYLDELAALLALALAHEHLELRAVVHFCLRAPLGVELVQRLVATDPSTVERIVDAVIESLEGGSEGAGTAADQLPLELTRARDACVAIASLTPAFAVIARDKLSARGASLWNVALALDLVVHVPVLQTDTAAFLFRMMKEEATTRAGAAAQISAFSAYVSLALADSSELQQQQQQQPSALQQMAVQHLSIIRQRLIEGLSRAASPYEVVVTLNVVIGLIVQASFRPSDHEAVQLLRWLDKAAKEAAQLLSSRVVSLAYVLVALLCYPLAPSLSKIPSQRDEATKTVLALSQQCIFSLYNTKASCPLFILSAVLLFTKSPSLLPFLASVVGNDALPVQALRVDYLHVFGDVVLKPILTESIMAREVLTFAPAAHFGARDSDILSEMTLRGLHGLLCEKSFLRHHHGRALEEWIASQVDHAVLPLHPLLLNVLLEWVENYVMAFEYPLAQKPVLQLSIIPLHYSTLSKWLSAACLAERLQPSDSNNERARAWCKAALALAYGLHFNQRLRHAMMVSGSKISGLSPDAHPPSGDVCLFYELSEFPLGNMVREVLAHGGKGQAFEFVAPTLLRLMVEEYPHRVASSLAASPDRSDLSQCWVRSRPQLVEFDDPAAADSWLGLSLSLSELETAPSRVLVRDYEAVVDRVLPSMILLSHQSPVDLPSSYSEDGAAVMQEPSLPAYTEIVFAQIARLYETRVSREHLRRTSLKMKLVHALCFPDLVRKHFQQRQQHGFRSSGVGIAPSHLMTYNQVVEEPFRVLSDAHDAVFRSPALLRVLLLLLGDFREAANVHMRKQDSAQVPRRQQLLQTALPSSGGAEPQPPSLISKTAAILHHLLVQDCLIVHALLSKIVVESRESAAATSPARDEDAQRECNRLLCAKVDALFRDEQNATLLPSKLVIAVHQQGYDSALVPVLVKAVPSMRLLWDHWMAQASSAAQSSSSSSSSSGARQSKVVNEFVAPEACEKELEKWSFRLRVFFSLCGTCFAPPSQTAVVLQTLRVVLNKLRSVLQAAIAGSVSNPAGTSTADSEELQKHAAFLDRVLPTAVAACAQHPELSAELVQFLLKLQKQGAVVSSSSNSSSSNGWRSGGGVSARKVVTPSRDVDDVLREAYALLLQQI